MRLADVVAGVRRTSKRQRGGRVEIEAMHVILQKVVSRKERKSRDWKVTVIVTQTQRRLTLVRMR